MRNGKYNQKHEQPNNQKANFDSFSHTCLRNTSLCYEMITFICNWDCAYINGFPILAENLNMFVLRTSAGNGSISFCGGRTFIG
jgi:hypothetical protein